MPRDAMRKRGLCRRLSVTFVYSIEMNKRIFKLFSPPGSHTTLAFHHQTLWQYSDGDLPNEGVECRWVGKNRDSLPTSAGFGIDD